MSGPINIVVLISGSGSNLQALIDDPAHGQSYQIQAVISNKPNAFGLERAQSAGITQQSIDHRLFNSRADFEATLTEQIDRHQPDLVILAGFMRVLGATFVQHYSNRMINIHPSLLPKYKGLHTHQRALDAGDSLHGLTIHFVSEELDGGPHVLQATVPVLQDDTAELLAQRVNIKELQAYPKVVNWYAEQRLICRNNQVHFDGNTLHQPLDLDTH